MDLDTLIVSVFCLIDDEMTSMTASQRLRERGPDPALCDSEVLTMEVAGEYLGLDQSETLFLLVGCMATTLSYNKSPLRQVKASPPQASDLWNVTSA